MTTERTYVCNFCRGDTTDPDKMHGLFWSTITGELKRAANASFSEDHLCESCLAAITAVGNKARQAIEEEH